MSKEASFLLKIDRLNAGYGKSQVLFDVDLVVKKNEIVALIGPNGAGKSTIIRSIFNLTNVHSGSISFKQKNILNLKTPDLIKQKIIYLNQGKVVFTNLTVYENLSLAGDILFSKEKTQEKITEVLDLFPALKKRKQQLALNLSGGLQQQLALSRALVQEPDLLLLDEPTLGLSPILQKELFEVIVALKKRNISFLMVEQNARSAIAVSDRTYLLENGKIKLEGGKKIIHHPLIKKVYLGGA